jgi:hypothetical protein
MLEKIKEFSKSNKDFLIASGTLITSAISDSMITLENIKKYGIDFEANPIIKSSINTFGENIGLYLPKITTIGFVIYTAKRMNDLDYKIKSEYLLYGASLYWSLDAFLNLIYR